MKQAEKCSGLKVLHNKSQQKSSHITSTWKYAPHLSLNLKVLTQDTLRASLSMVITPPSTVWFIYMQTCTRVQIFLSECLHIYFRMDGAYVNFFTTSSNLKNDFIFLPFPPYFGSFSFVFLFFFSTHSHLFLEYFIYHNINDRWTFLTFVTEIHVSISVSTYFENKPRNYSSYQLSISPM